MAGDIIYRDTIIINVAEKMKLPDHVVNHVYNFIFPYIKKKTKEDGVVSIPLSKIGRLYLKSFKLEKRLESRERRKNISERQKMYNRRLKRKVTMLHDEIDKLFDGEFIFTNHKTASNLKKYYYNSKKKYDELEYFQNTGKV